MLNPFCKPSIESTSPKFQNVVPANKDVRPLSQPKRGMELEYMGPSLVIFHFLSLSAAKVSGLGRLAVVCGVDAKGLVANGI